MEGIVSHGIGQNWAPFVKGRATHATPLNTAEGEPASVAAIFLDSQSYYGGGATEVKSKWSIEGLTVEIL